MEREDKVMERTEEDRAAVPCDATLGIGVIYHCERPDNHPGPHGIEGHGGLWTWWRIEWDQTPEKRR